MSTQEINIANALLTAKEFIANLLSQGLADAKYIFAVSNILVEKFNLTQDQSIIILEEALKLA